MGRNSIPKLYEWRDGSRYRFRVVSDDDDKLTPENGKLIVYERQYQDGIETLATAYADGLSELMAAMFEAGYRRGKTEGYHTAQADIRKALGVQP